MARFFKTSSEMSKTLLNSSLTAAEWRIWCYLSDIDPFGDEYVELPPMVDILNACGISDRTFYRAIAKFKGTFFDFQYDKAYIRNLHNNFVADKNGSSSDKNVSRIVKNGSDTDKNGRTSIYTELQTNQTLSEAKEKIETTEIDTATNGTNLSAIATIETHFLAKTEFSPIEKFSEARTTKTVQQKNFNWLPEGPWNLDGKLDPNFRDFVANDWLKRFGGDIHSKRADVLSHFKKDPDNLPIRWEQYQSEYLNRFESTQILLNNGVEIPEEYQYRLINNQRAITQSLPQELNPVLQPTAIMPAPELSLSKIPELPQAVKNEKGQSYKLFRAADIEVTPEEAKANRKFLKDAIGSIFGNKIKRETPKTLPLVEQLNIWLNDPILRETAINQVNKNSDRFECLFDDAGNPYQIIEIQPTEEYDF